MGKSQVQIWINLTFAVWYGGSPRMQLLMVSVFCAGLCFARITGMRKTMTTR